VEFTAQPNPFHVLRLPVEATKAQVVRRGEELSQFASDAEIVTIREAVAAIITHPDVRRRHELLEVPGARYRTDEWAGFERRYRKNPVDLDALAAAARPLAPADFDPAAIIGLLLDGLLQPPEPDLRPALRHAPVPPDPAGPPLEVRDVLFG
jgi:hypothetical protein